MKIVIRNLATFAFVCGLLFVGGTEASANAGMGVDSMDGCTGCHSTQGEDGDNIGNSVPNTPAAKPPGHEGYTAEQCAGCHSDLSGTNHAANDNCAGCHTEQAVGDVQPIPANHYSDIHTGFANNVGADNAEGGSCDSCHEVHMSEDSQYLTKDVNGNNQSEDSETCMQCHSDKIDSGHPTSGCSNCHNIHDTTPVAETDASCLTCHTGYDKNHYGSSCTGCHT